MTVIITISFVSVTNAEVFALERLSFEISDSLAMILREQERFVSRISPPSLVRILYYTVSPDPFVTVSFGFI